MTSIDESREQTKKILMFQRKQYMDDSFLTKEKKKGVIARHRNFQRLLQPMGIKNPYAKKLTYKDDRLQGRRDQPKYLNLIKAVAFLRQMQKETKTDKQDHPYIEIDIEDIKIANSLAHDILGKSLDELSRPGRDLLMLLDEMIEQIAEDRQSSNSANAADYIVNRTEITFNRREIRDFTGWSNYRVHTHIKELVKFEYILVESGRNGLPYRYRLAYEGQGQHGQRFKLGLIETEALQ